MAGRPRRRHRADPWRDARRDRAVGGARASHPARREPIGACWTHSSRTAERCAADRGAADPRRRFAPTRRLYMVMGLPAAGKSTLTEQFVADGYQRLNRDETGGTLRGLLPELRRLLSADTPRIVLDNTYVTRQSRAAVIQVAAELGVPIRCVWLATTVDDAQVNAVTRLITRYGKLPDESELAVLRKTDVAAFPPTVLFRYQRELEPPDAVRRVFANRCDAVRAASGSGPRESRGHRVVRRCDRARVARVGPARISGRGLEAVSCSRGNRRSQTARGPTLMCAPCSRPRSSAKDWRWTWISVRMVPVRPVAGAASRCPVSACS